MWSRGIRLRKGIVSMRIHTKTRTRLLALEQAENDGAQAESCHGEVENDVVAGEHDSVGDAAEALRGRKVVGGFGCGRPRCVGCGEGVHFAQELCVVVLVVGIVVMAIAIRCGCHGGCRRGSIFPRQRETRYYYCNS